MKRQFLVRILGALSCVLAVLLLAGCVDNTRTLYSAEFECRDQGVFRELSAAQANTGCLDYSVLGPVKDGRPVLRPGDWGIYIFLGGYWALDPSVSPAVTLVDGPAQEASLPEDSYDWPEMVGSYARSWTLPEGTKPDLHPASGFVYLNLGFHYDQARSAADPTLVWNFLRGKRNDERGEVRGKDETLHVEIFSQGRMGCFVDDAADPFVGASSADSFYVSHHVTAASGPLSHLAMYCAKCQPFVADRLLEDVPATAAAFFGAKFAYGTSLVLFDDATQRPVTVHQTQGADGKALFLTFAGEVTGRTLYIAPEYLDSIIVGADREAAVKAFTDVGLKVVVEKVPAIAE